MALSDQQALERHVDAVVARLRERLSPEEYDLVSELRHLEELAILAACAEWEQRALDALARHFPEHELAIRGVAAHVRTTNADCDTLQGLRVSRLGN